MVRCYLCRSSKIDDIQYGELLQNANMAVHTFCLYLSSNLAQNGADDEGFLGFLEVDIKKEARRVSQLVCAYCRKIYANVGCCEPKCRRTFHFICGLENGAENRFCNSFMSYCDRHVRKGRGLPPANATCVICYDNLREGGTRFHHVNTIQAPCCRNGWFHKLCLQKFAKTAGYFFKCPLCNDAKLFRQKLPSMGIFIPNQDAAWELEPNAFAELLERPNECGALICKNKQGRTHSSSNNPFIFCTTCGSTAMHKQCITNRAKRFHCADCTVMEQDSGRESYNHNGGDEWEIDVCNVSDKEDLDIVRGLLLDDETPTENAKQKSIHIYSSDDEDIRLPQRRRARLLSSDSNNSEKQSLSSQNNCSSSDDKLQVPRVSRRSGIIRDSLSSEKGSVCSTTSRRTTRNVIVDDEVEIIHELAESVDKDGQGAEMNKMSGEEADASEQFDRDSRLSISSDELGAFRSSSKRCLRLLSDDEDVEASIKPEKQSNEMPNEDGDESNAAYSSDITREAHIPSNSAGGQSNQNVDILDKISTTKHRQTNESSGEEQFASKSSKNKIIKTTSIHSHNEKSLYSIPDKANNNIVHSSCDRNHHTHRAVNDDNDKDVGNNDFRTSDKRSNVGRAERDSAVDELSSFEDSDDDPLEYFAKFEKRRKNISCIAQSTRTKSKQIANYQQFQQAKEGNNATASAAIESANCKTQGSRKSMKLTETFPREKKKTDLDTSCIAKRTRRKTMNHGYSEIKEEKCLEPLCQPLTNPLDVSCVAIRTRSRRKTVCAETSVERKKQQRKASDEGECTDAFSSESSTPISEEILPLEFSKVYEKEVETDEETPTSRLAAVDDERDGVTFLETSCIANRTRKRKGSKLQNIREEDDSSISSARSSSSIDTYKIDLKSSNRHHIRKPRKLSSSSSEGTGNNYSDAVPKQYINEQWPEQNYDLSYSNIKLHTGNKWSYYPNNQHHPHLINRKRV